MLRLAKRENSGDSIGQQPRFALATQGACADAGWFISTAYPLNIAEKDDAQQGDKEINAHGYPTECDRLYENANLPPPRTPKQATYRSSTSTI
jgi:hypothetical protein